MFRNSVSYISRYCEQMEALKGLLERDGHELQLVLGYGDSNDGTGVLLRDECSHRLLANLFNVSHGGHHYGSIVHPIRFKQLAFVCNCLWQHIPDGSDIVGFVEADLIWDAYDVYNMMSALNLSNLPAIIAPMVMHTDGRFYDKWAFRMGGISFQNGRPFHPHLIDPEISSRRYYRMESVGSVLFGHGELMRKLRWPEEDVVVGLCRQARESGAQIILDSFTEVYHP